MREIFVSRLMIYKNLVKWADLQCEGIDNLKNITTFASCFS